MHPILHARIFLNGSPRFILTLFTNRSRYGFSVRSLSPQYSWYFSLPNLSGFPRPDSFNRRALTILWLWGSNQAPAARAKLDELSRYCDQKDPTATCYTRLVRQLFKYNQLTKALQYTNCITSWFSPSSYTLTLKGDVEAAAEKFDLAKKSYKQGLTASLNAVEQATIAAKLKTLEEAKQRYENTQ